MKRKYTKKNCNYWGHDVRYIYVALDSDTKKAIAYHGICRRCNKRVFLPTNGKVDRAALTHLFHTTLEDLPAYVTPDVDYEVMRIFKK